APGGRGGPTRWVSWPPGWARSIGIARLAGPAIASALRRRGAGRHRLGVTTAARPLLPLARFGFGLAAVSGAAMFVSGASAVAASAAAPWKLGLLVLAGANVAAFHGGVYRTVSRWDVDAPPPGRARDRKSVV